MSLNLNKTKHIHFIGVGGIGVSAMARMMKYHGKHVSGSDRVLSPITHDLENIGVRVRPGHDEHHVPLFADLVVYSPAIAGDNPEMIRARGLHIPTLSYPEVLGEISKEAFTVAVSGTHGKTTTTAMIADVLAKDINPTVIVGSLLKGGRSNFVPGHTKRFLVEACEYKRSFLHLHPSVLVITNIDEDHLDYYKDLKDIQSAFRELALKVPSYGAIVCNTDDSVVQETLAGISVPILNYMAHYNPDRELFVFGEHNTKNAAIAHTVGEFFSVPEETINDALANFRGTWRRSEYKGRTTRGTEVFDDYAHHPQEIRTTLAGFKKRFPDKNIVVVFQPHLYSRTKTFFNDFAESFHNANRVLLAPIYAAREAHDPSISHHMLGDALRQYGKQVESYETLDALSHTLSRSVEPNDVVITMGAGDIYKVGERLLV
ncbi:MAG: UDP-N-acetylmuramate--L-alanine ligase [Candidatus Campbellbacteria bacterium]|nr:UDP-N-acetylmuramate--L-alanine ligase [Candidatus Campbellbacteria bacterium]